MKGLISLILMAVIAGLSTIAHCQGDDRERFVQQQTSAATRAVILEKSRQLDHTDPARTVERERLVVRINDQAGVSAYGFIHRQFVALQETIRVIRCQTIRPDGSRLILPDNAANTVSPEEAINAPEYQHWQELVITPLGLEPGAVVELELERISRVDTLVAGQTLWQDSDPVFRQSLTLQLPHGRSILRWRSSKAVRERFKPSAACDRWEWWTDSMPGFPAEEDRPDDEYLAPRLLYSNQAFWHRAVRQFDEDFLQPSMDTAGLTTNAALLTARSTGACETVRAVAGLLNEKIRQIDVELDINSCWVRTPRDIMRSQYGDNRERAALFLALLSACSVKAYPVLTTDGDAPVITSIPDLGQFNRLLVAVEDGPAIRFFDPVQRWARPGYLGACAGKKGLLVKPQGVSWVELPSIDAEHNQMRLGGRLAMAGKREWQASCSLAVSGEYEQLWLEHAGEPASAMIAKTIDQGTRSWARQAATEDPAMAAGSDSSGPTIITWGSRLTGFEQVQGQMMVVTMPAPSFGFLDLLPWPEQERRQLPMMTDGPIRQASCWRIETPEGYRPVGLPGNIRLENEVGSFMFNARLDGRSIVLTNEIVIKPAMVMPEQYGQLRELVAACNSPGQRHLLLSKHE